MGSYSLRRVSKAKKCDENVYSMLYEINLGRQELSNTAFICVDVLGVL